MSKFIKGNPATPEYWDQRVKSIPDKKDMLFLDSRRDEYWQRVRQQLNLWKDLTALDLACGYGQFAYLFKPENYLGVDFSTEMLTMAMQENPPYDFVSCNLANFEPLDKFDVIFEVNSLHSLGWTPEQFFEKFSPYAKVAVACLEADQFIIKQLYI